MPLIVFDRFFDLVGDFALDLLGAAPGGAS
jgi:hypothetical protein